MAAWSSVHTHTAPAEASFDPLEESHEIGGFAHPWGQDVPQCGAAALILKINTQYQFTTKPSQRQANATHKTIYI